MNTTVMRAELELDAILREHEDLLEQAQGFGMRTAAIPRGLMPLREAQTIVAQFDANTKKLVEFADSLSRTMMHAPDKATGDALREISDRASKALRKFEADLKLAKESLVKHEDLLVGENFQKMFQALRLAVLDLDLTSNADFKAKTQLYLDANPAYAVGVATVFRIDPKENVYQVRATYKAETDEYVADMWSKRANRWFPAAKKTGHARIAAFVKAVVDKMKAVHDFEGETLFGSRRSVEDTSPDVVQYRSEVDERKRRDREQRAMDDATAMINRIAQAIDRKLKERFPTGVTRIYPLVREAHPEKTSILIWNQITVDGVAVQLGTGFNVHKDGRFVFPKTPGHFGIVRKGGKNNNPVSASNESEYVDRAVDALANAVTSSGGRIARTTRTAGATTFENLVWIADVNSAFRHIRQEQLDAYGHRDGYPGTIAAKSKYNIRSRELMTEVQARAFADMDIDRNNKWGSEAFAVPVTKSTVLSTDKVTVTVTARDEREALRQAKMQIYATGRFPPDADVVVSELVSKKIAETPRTETFDVTGTRKVVLAGKIDGWLFYGWAPE